ncbi:hypothetical protein Pcinc_029419 [Petrolisthes cinctipes]|uniref:Uncharacterized protein n=1 Tax=Petrolisthes cinctipes TaxID=88211 RepID=A0AAE1F040_PETCI|nr:hypothetical protein Pcinc_029419 [Petrolisthes cinctipes]
MKTFCLLALTVMVVGISAEDVSDEVPVPKSFHQPQVDPRPTGPFLRPPAQPGYEGVMTLPAAIPEGWTSRQPRHTGPFLRPQAQPGYEGVMTLPAAIPEGWARPQPRPTGPFLRPQAQPGYQGVMTLPAVVPEGWRNQRGSADWTRPQPRPDVPSFQRPQIQPPRPTNFIPSGEKEICSTCDNFSFKRKGACCRRWNLCC